MNTTTGTRLAMISIAASLGSYALSRSGWPDGWLGFLAFALLVLAGVTIACSLKMASDSMLPDAPSPGDR